MAFLSRTFQLLAISFLLILTTGCSKRELYSQLQEKEANEMIAILLRYGIDSEKTPGAENTFTVHVQADRFSESVTILNDFGYPQDHFAGMGEVFKKSGLVSSPVEERIRYMHALSEELQETITLISGVLAARVHVVIPNNDPLAENIYPSSAAVFIKYRKNAGVEDVVSQIKNLVVKSIEGLTYENVSVALFPVSEGDITAPAGEIPSIPMLTKQESSNTAVLVVVFLLFVMVSVGGVAGYYFLVIKKKETTTDSTEEES